MYWLASTVFQHIQHIVLYYIERYYIILNWIEWTVYSAVTQFRNLSFDCFAISLFVFWLNPTLLLCCYYVIMLCYYVYFIMFIVSWLSSYRWLFACDFMWFYLLVRRVSCGLVRGAWCVVCPAGWMAGVCLAIGYSIFHICYKEYNIWYMYHQYIIFTCNQYILYNISNILIFVII